MNSTNDATLRVKKALSNKKSLSIGCLILSCLCCFSILVLGYFLPPTIELVSDDNGKTILEPSYKIIADCIGITQLKLNEKELSTEELDAICSETGYTVELTNGDNNFNLEGSGSRDKKVNLIFTVKFDEAKYIAKLTQEDKDKLAKEEEDKEKQEQEASQKAQQEAKALSEWKNRYYQYKSSNIDVNFTKSSEMIQVLSNGTDPYESRNQANNYKEYFVSRCKATLENDLETIPSTVSQEIKDLNTYYSDFCLHNYSLASRIVSYFESSSIEDQYDDLDMITYYMGEVNNAKLDMESEMSKIDAKLK
jgi:hypothetical protein